MSWNLLRSEASTICYLVSGIRLMDCAQIIRSYLMTLILVVVAPVWADDDSNDPVFNFGHGVWSGYVQPVSSMFSVPESVEELLGRMAGLTLHTAEYVTDSQYHYSPSHDVSWGCSRRCEEHKQYLQKVLPRGYWRYSRQFHVAAAPYAMALGSGIGLYGTTRQIANSLRLYIHDDQKEEGIRLLSSKISANLYKTLKDMIYDYDYDEVDNCIFRCGLVQIDIYALLQNSFRAQYEVETRASEVYGLIQASHGWGSRARYDTASTANYLNKKLGIKHDDYVTLRNQFLSNKAHHYESQTDLDRLIRVIVYILTANQYQWLEMQAGQSAEELEAKIIQYAGNITIIAYQLLLEWLNHPGSLHSCYYNRCYGFWSYLLWPFNLMGAVESLDHIAPEPLTGHPYALDRELFDWYLLTWTDYKTATAVFEAFKAYYKEQVCSDYDDT
ncbi:hypothetical protein [Endozoicomonas sp.]|uniref:hypothetical protein n=1 Tax=Endozoicomonas sp. TaxID=1892382 RepID=UPI003D9B88EE